MTDKPTVVELLLMVMNDVQAVRKADRNNEQGYNFRGIDAVVNAVGPKLREHGVLPVPVLRNATYRDVTTSRGKPSRECTVEVAYRFYGPAGDFVEAVVPGESMDFGDKGAAKAMSVAYRIVLLQALCIPTDEVEPDSQTYERAHRDEWGQVAKPPTPAQVAEAAALANSVRKASTADELREVWESAKASRSQDLLTDAQGSDLRREFDARLAELRAQPAGDGGERNA